MVEGSDMNVEHLKKARKVAEQVVADMPPGDMKLKAFEVTLAKLLDGSSLLAGEVVVAVPEGRRTPPTQMRRTTAAVPSSLPERLEMVRQEEFFRDLRGLSEVKAELGTRGWHYPVTTLSGAMQSMVQQRKLRRVKGKVGGRTVWKYSNS